MSDSFKACQGFTQRYLRRPWSAADGLPESEISRAESRLGIMLPSPLRSFYLSVGGVADICSIHNRILHPKDLEFEDDHLMIMDENQNVVSWGIKKEDLTKPDPEIWQRNNRFNQWNSEKKGFIELITSMFDWYAEIGIWEHEGKAGHLKRELDKIVGEAKRRFPKK